MTVSEYLYPILSAAAVLMAKSAAGEFAKSAGKEAFEKLKSLLSGKHEVKNLDLLDRVAETPALESAIRASLDESRAASDPEVKSLAEAVLAAIDATQARAAVPAIDVGSIRSKGDQLFEQVEGLRADSIVSEEGALSFKDISAPKG